MGEARACLREKLQHRPERSQTPEPFAEGGGVAPRERQDGHDQCNPEQRENHRDQFNEGVRLMMHEQGDERSDEAHHVHRLIGQGY